MLLAEANRLLTSTRLIADNKALKKIVESRLIPHAYQTLKSPKQWRIPLSEKGKAEKEKLDKQNKQRAKENQYTIQTQILNQPTLCCPIELEADVVRFQNNKEKWIAFVGLKDGKPYEIFTGLADDDDGIFCPKNVVKGKIVKAVNEDGTKRYDFQFSNKRGYKTTIEGLSDKFNPEYWNYAKLISGVLRYGMPIPQVLKLVSSLELDSQSINSWKNGVERALKKYLPNGTKANGQTCPHCGNETLIYQEGCLICTSCGTSKCG